MRDASAGAGAAAGLPGEAEAPPRIAGESETSGTLGMLSYSAPRSEPEPVGGPGESSDAHGSALRM